MGNTVAFALPLCCKLFYIIYFIEITKLWSETASMNDGNGKKKKLAEVSLLPTREFKATEPLANLIARHYRLLLKIGNLPP